MEKRRTRALDVHEEGVRRLYETLQLVLDGLRLGVRVQQVEVLQRKATNAIESDGLEMEKIDRLENQSMEK
jgi:hypothetical protein